MYVVMTVGRSMWNVIVRRRELRWEVLAIRDQPGLMGYNGGHDSSSLFLVGLAPFAREMAGTGGWVQC